MFQVKDEVSIYERLTLNVHLMLRNVISILGRLVINSQTKIPAEQGKRRNRYNWLFVKSLETFQNVTGYNSVVFQKKHQANAILNVGLQKNFAL